MQITRYLGALAIIFSMSCGEQVVVRETEASCGNSMVEAGEDCDDGNSTNTDSCTNACEVAACGDGVTRTDLGADDEGFEACDDGNEVDTDSCTNGCVLAVCGDGVIRTDLSEGAVGFEAVRRRERGRFGCVPKQLRACVLRRRNCAH